MGGASADVAWEGRVGGANGRGAAGDNLSEAKKLLIHRTIDWTDPVEYAQFL